MKNWLCRFFFFGIKGSIFDSGPMGVREKKWQKGAFLGQFASYKLVEVKVPWPMLAWPMVGWPMVDWPMVGWPMVGWPWLAWPWLAWPMVPASYPAGQHP